MATARVLVRVVDGADEIQANAQRPVRLTPDGYAGVVYAGATYPLHHGDLIDLSGPSWEVEDCNRFVIAGAPIPYAPPSGDTTRTLTGFTGEWYVESSRLGHYVLFNATEPVAGRLVDALETAGLAVQRWDVSHRTASDGRFYDWFARLRFQGDHEQCVNLVAEALSPAVSRASSRSKPPVPTDMPSAVDRPDDRHGVVAQDRLEELAEQVERLTLRVTDLEALLVESQREASRLHGEVERTQEMLAKKSSALDRAQAHRKALREEVAALRASTGSSDELRDLLSKYSDTEELLELALAENATLHQQNEQMFDRGERDRTEIENLRVQLDDIWARFREVDEQEADRRRAVAPRRAPRVGVEGFLARTYPRLDFLFDSLESLADFDSPGPVLRLLDQIDRGERVGRDLESIRGWSEVSRVPTGTAGRDDMGRIYYCPRDGTVLVCVHIKRDEKDQRRLLDRLRGL